MKQLFRSQQHQNIFGIGVLVLSLVFFWASIPFALAYFFFPYNQKHPNNPVSWVCGVLLASAVIALLVIVVGKALAIQHGMFFL